MKKSITSLLLVIAVLSFSACRGDMQMPEETIEEATTTAQTEETDKPIESARIENEDKPKLNDCITFEQLKNQNYSYTEVKQDNAIIYTFDNAAYVKTPDNFFYNSDSNPELFYNGSYIGEISTFRDDEWVIVKKGDTISGMTVTSASISTSAFKENQIELLSETVELDGSVELMGVLRCIGNDHMIYDEGDLFFYPYPSSLIKENMMIAPSMSDKGLLLETESGYSMYADTLSMVTQESVEGELIVILCTRIHFLFILAMQKVLQTTNL